MITQLPLTADLSIIVEPHQTVFRLTHWEIRTGNDMIPNPPAPTVIPIGDFCRRFSEEEMDQILTLAYSGVGDATMKKFLLKLSMEEAIDCCNPLVVTGMKYLAMKNCITMIRMGEILSGCAVSPPTEWNEFD